MTNEQLILKYNPANAANLKSEDFDEMRKLTDEQISVLAEAYPNLPSRKSYLRLYNNSLAAHKQLYQLSTWQNLRNVRKFSNQKNLVAYDFYVPGARAAALKATKAPAITPKKVVVDLTAQEAADELRKSFEKKPMIAVKDLGKTPEIKRPIGRPKKIEVQEKVEIQEDLNFDDPTK